SSATSSTARGWSGTAARSAGALGAFPWGGGAGSSPPRRSTPPPPAAPAGAVAVFLWAWWRGFLTLALLDLAAPALALGYAIGRCGCQVSGDGDYGRPWDGPWGVAHPDGGGPHTR